MVNSSWLLPQWLLRQGRSHYSLGIPTPHGLPFLFYIWAVGVFHPPQWLVWKTHWARVFYPQLCYDVINSCCFTRFYSFKCFSDSMMLTGGTAKQIFLRSVQFIAKLFVVWSLSNDNRLLYLTVCILSKKNLEVLVRLDRKILQKRFGSLQEDGPWSHGFEWSSPEIISISTQNEDVAALFQIEMDTSE